MHGKFTLTITLGNEAMETPDDVAGALCRLAETFAEYLAFASFTGTVRDTNGNAVGKWAFTKDED